MSNKASTITTAWIVSILMNCTIGNYFVLKMYYTHRGYTLAKIKENELCLEQQQVCRRYGGASEEYQEAMRQYKNTIETTARHQVWKSMVHIIKEIASE